MPECDFGDDNREIEYDQPWLKHAIPSTNGQLESCVRYVPKNQTTTLFAENMLCSANLFNSSQRIQCSEYIYSTDERNIQTEVQKKEK